MTTRAAPGVQLAVGRLRVDAAKAIAKLREYQLADRTAWVLEAIRAAVASGATQLELRGDANDIWLVWDGPAWPADDLPRLFDELVSPEPTSERHHLRLLAAAVNSALGMNPAYVDVFAITDGVAVRARYTPDVLEDTTEGDEHALRKIAVVPATAPAGTTPQTGMVVHVRRRASLGMVTYLFWDREPPELGAARAACRDIAVPLRIGRSVLHRDNRTHDVARVELGEGLDGFVAIVDPDALRSTTEYSAVMEVAERGVVLATYLIELGPSEPRAPVPLRLFVNAPRMPTNASRSQVRRDSHPIAAAEQRAAKLATELIDQLATQLAAGTAPERGRDAALALLATELAGHDWAMPVSRSPVFDRLAKLPLVRDATGKPAAVARVWRGIVHTADEPFPEALAPWVGDVLWIPHGDAAARLVAGSALDARAMRRHARWAKQQLRAHRRFFELAPRTRKPAERERPRVRMSLGSALAETCVPLHLQGRFTGEIQLRTDRFGGEVVLLLKGREIERVKLDVTIGFEASIDSDRFAPADGYRGVVRDGEFDSAIRVVRAGVVMATEGLAHVLTGGRVPDGFELHGDPSDHDARLVREALVLAAELELTIQPPLATAKVWPTVTGELASLVDLHAHQVIGVATQGANLRAPRRRITLDGGSERVLAKLVPHATLVRYEAFRSAGSDVHLIAVKLAASNRHALEIALPSDDLVRGAIAPGFGTSRIQLCHVGVELDTRPYAPMLLPSCKITIDSDAFVPNAAWTAAAFDDNVATRSFLAWEMQLVRTIAAALGGEPTPGLHGPPITEFDGDAGRVLCHALGRGDPPAVLGPELVAKLRTRALVRVLGSRELITMAELAKRFPGTIPYVDKTSVPVEGYAPLLADATVAEAIAALVGSKAADGTPDLELRRRQVKRKEQLARHRQQPEVAPHYPFANEPHINLDVTENAVKLTGCVGVAHGGLDIRVRIERRPFVHITRDGPPLHAIVELDYAHADVTFEGLSELVTETIVTAVKRAAWPLLEHVAVAVPQLLGELGPVRTLLAQLPREAMPPKTRERLGLAVAFTTVQGDRVSILQASQPLGAVSVASWQGSWLAALETEAASAFDHNVIQIPAAAGELQAIITKLHTGAIVDVTNDVAKLQSDRRMARGLIPPPSLPHVPRELKRKLAELGELGKKLGHGELGLVETAVSIGLLHLRGTLAQRVTLPVMPAVHVALEGGDALEIGPHSTVPQFELGATVTEQLRALRDPDFGRGANASSTTLAVQIQELTTALVRQVLATVPHDSLAPAIRRNLRRAVLAKRLPVDAIGDAPLFEDTTGRWIGWPMILEQRVQFGNVWAVTRPTTDRPLDEGRRVLVLATEELISARANFSMIDASQELELDGLARRNRARAPADSLELPFTEGVLATRALDPDSTATRGNLAVLLPVIADRRGVHAHRDMHPFDLSADPCPWPTLAVLDDPRLQPDRTWSQPLTSGAWQDVAAQLRIASERALASVVAEPDAALVFERVTTATREACPKLRLTNVEIRGGLWLIGTPRRSPDPKITVIDPFGRHAYAPAGHLAMAGTLYVHAPGGWQRDLILDELCSVVYGKLLVALMRSTGLEHDLVAAHVAHGLALGMIPPAAVSITFPCFQPTPLGGLELAAVLRGISTYRIVKSGETWPGAAAIDDGSELSRIVIATIGERGRRGRPPAPPPIPRPSRLSEPAPRTPPPPPEPDHAIQNVVDAVAARLSALGVPMPEFRISARGLAIMQFSGSLWFAGDDRRLLAIANALRTRSPWASLALDALVAHTITVLDVALVDVNAATTQHVLDSLLAGR
ncbi:MAG: hypothetical protein ABI867_09945 [Kofleriaceae bacterium]